MNIDQLVKTSLEAEIIKAFKEAPEAIDALVSACLRMEVDEYGGKTDYNSRVQGKSLRRRRTSGALTYSLRAKNNIRTHEGPPMSGPVLLVRSSRPVSLLSQSPAPCTRRGQ